MLLPSHARHARPAPARSGSPAATWSAPLLALVGVVLLAAALLNLGSGRQAPLRTVPLPPPPADVPVELAIPAIDVSVGVKPVGLTIERHLEVPDFGESGWYQPGPVPGQAGYAVIAGHIDSRNGPDVFHQLHTLREGQDVQVRMSTGAVVTFSVDQVKRQKKEALADSVMWEPSDRPHLALITCGGKFNHDRHTYPDNVIVYATAI